jgi:DNA-binding IclR family transcriptional regulator
VSALKNAAEVLRCFGNDCPDLTVTDVVRRLGMPKANASRLLKAMREAKMLETIGATHRHRPGKLMLDLAAAFRRSSMLIGRTSDVVADVTRKSGHTGYISVRDGREVTAVADFPGTNTLRVVSNIGRRLPAHLSATGRTLLARLTDDEVSELYAGHDNLGDLLTRLATIRAQGYALSSQEATAGVDAIAIAVADRMTDEAVSLCIVYPHSLVSDAERAEMIEALARGARRIAEDLGDTAFVVPVPEKKDASV